MVQLSHSYVTSRKTIALTIQNLVGKVLALVHCAPLIPDLFIFLRLFLIKVVPMSHLRGYK